MASKELHVVGFPSYLDIVFIAFVLFLTAFMYLYRTIALTDTFIFDFKKRPRLISLYFKGLCRGVWMRQGQLHPGDSDSDALQIYARNCSIEVPHLQLYKSVCSYLSQCKIPVCYVEHFTIPVVTNLITSSKFRLSCFGIIHIRQVTDQYEDLKVATPYNASATVAEYRSTDRGVEADLKVELFNEEERCVVRSIMTLLSRCKGAQKGGGRKSQEQAKGEAQEKDEKNEEIKFTVPKGLGLRYAKVSGDYNLPHLYGVTAKLVGFKSPIAHGMWTISRALAELNSKGAIKLGAPLHYEAAFKRPLYIPSDVVLKHCKEPGKESFVSFRVENATTGEPHVIGSVTNDVNYIT